MVVFAHLDQWWRKNCGEGMENIGKSWELLALRLKSGNHDAAAELVDLYYRQIYLFMRRLGNDRQMSEDLTQETFIQAWQHIGQLKNHSALNSWLYHIAANVSNLNWRRNKGKGAVSLEEMQLQSLDEGKFDRLERFEQLCRLNGAIVELPIKLRQAIVLHYMQQLTISEAAEAAGIREGTFKSRLSRALKALRKQVVCENGELL